MISESNGLSMIRVKVTKKRAAVAVVLAARPAGPAGRVAWRPHTMTRRLKIHTLEVIFLPRQQFWDDLK